ncbi:MAG: class I SAM-dependent methyltransferase [Lautropia sp.]
MTGVDATPSRGRRAAGIDLPFEVRAFQSFVRGLRGVWREEAYSATVAAARSAGADRNEVELERRLRGHPAYELYAWLERHSQQLKYYGRGGIVRYMEAHADEAQRLLDAAAACHPERLDLDPAFVVPPYVRDVDTHQHAGGLFAGASAALAYEASSTGFSFSLFDARSPMLVYGEEAVRLLGESGGEGRCIVDLGCTIGGSTRALKRALPAAQVIGVDVCGPVLALAHLRSLEQGLEIAYRQRSADALDLPDAAVDLVASHWLFHEMPPAAIRRTLREARRVLRPNGALIVFDMYLRPGGAIGRWLHAGYAARNNEPFAHTYAEMDIVAELEAAGFRDTSVRLAHPTPDARVAAGELPEARTHYMTMVTARAAFAT